MSKDDYSKLLRDPRWQKRRLHILEQHEFKCDECGDDKSELQVHHCYYEKDCKPWEYDDDCFKVLCDRHHMDWHEVKKLLDYHTASLSIRDMSSLFSIIAETEPGTINKIASIILKNPTEIDFISSAFDVVEEINLSIQKRVDFENNKSLGKKPK